MCMYVLNNGTVYPEDKCTAATFNRVSLIFPCNSGRLGNVHALLNKHETIVNGRFARKSAS